MAWTHEQIHNARIIIGVGERLGASQRDIQIALMTALTESNLHNYTGGDRDSVGLFQQRAAWGSFDQRHDPAAAARMFFQGGHAGQRGLFDFSNRDSMSMGAAAQAVQVSAFPDRYAEHTQGAAQLLHGNTGAPLTNGPLGGVFQTINAAADAVGSGADKAAGVNKDEFDPNFATEHNDGSAPDYMQAAVQQTDSNTAGVGHYAAPMALGDLPDDRALPHLGKGGPGGGPGGGGPGGPGGVAGEQWRRQVVQFARRFLGTPYVWGGTTPQGFDCSGFVQYVYKHLGVNLPRISADQATSGRRISLDDMRVGDLVGWNNSSRNNGADHIAIYIGHGRIIEAPRPGLSVQISNLYDQNIAWGVRMHR